MHNRIGLLLMAGVLAVSACASRDAVVPPAASVTDAPGPAVVAWVDRPAPPYVEPTPTPTTFPTDARPCRAADLTASSGGVGAAGGTANVRIELTNHGATACVLLGHPSVAGLSADGTITTLDAGHGSIIGDRPWPEANTEPGQIAAVNVSSADECAAVQRDEQQIYPTLRIGLPSGDFVDVPSHGFDTVCGVSVSRFGVPALAEPLNDPAPSPLTAHMNAPQTAQAGEDLDYTVTLHNRSDSAYQLIPCPAYEEYVGLGVPGGAFVHPNYYLNCDTVQQIPTGGAVTYEMHLKLPTDLGGTGPAKFGWQLQRDVGPVAVALLQITG